MFLGQGKFGKNNPNGKVKCIAEKRKKKKKTFLKALLRVSFDFKKIFFQYLSIKTSL